MPVVRFVKGNNNELTRASEQEIQNEKVEKYNKILSFLNIMNLDENKGEIIFNVEAKFSTTMLLKNLHLILRDTLRNNTQKKDMNFF